MLKVVQETTEPKGNAPAAVGVSLLDELVRDGARAVLAKALQAEVAAKSTPTPTPSTRPGHRLVVRNGHHGERQVATAAGAVPVRALRVNDRRTDEATGKRKRLASAILPAWARKSPGHRGVLPLVHLRGLSTGDFVAASWQFLGSTAGLSAATITRLTRQWQDDAEAFGWRSLACTDHAACRSTGST